MKNTLSRALAWFPVRSVQLADFVTVHMLEVASNRDATHDIYMRDPVGAAQRAISEMMNSLTRIVCTNTVWLSCEDGTLEWSQSSHISSWIYTEPNTHPIKLGADYSG
jgi:hypothetical protein